MNKQIFLPLLSVTLATFLFYSCSKNSASPSNDFATQVAGNYTISFGTYAGIPITVTGPGNSANAMVSKMTPTTIEINLSTTYSAGSTPKTSSFDFKNLTLKITAINGLYEIDSAGSKYGTIGNGTISASTTSNSNGLTFLGTKN